MGQQSIAARLRRLLVVSFAALGLLAVVGLGSGLRMSDLFSNFRASSSNTDLTSELAREVAKLRMGAFRFRLAPVEENAWAFAPLLPGSRASGRPSRPGPRCRGTSSTAWRR